VRGWGITTSKILACIVLVRRPRPRPSSSSFPSVRPVHSFRRADKDKDDDIDGNHEADDEVEDEDEDDDHEYSARN
jgi:hypothetical protein